MPSSRLKEQVETYYALCQIQSAKSLSHYLNHVLIDTRPEPRKLGDVARSWQRRRNEILTPALEQAAGIRLGYEGPRKFWLEYPRGSDKSGTLARLFNWLLGFSKHYLRLYACAADRDQAGDLRLAMESEYRLNAAWHPKLEFSKYAVSGPGGEIEMLASDAATNQGKRPDGLGMEEVSTWTKPDLWDAMTSTLIKRPTAFMIVLTNAGGMDSWQWGVRQHVIEMASQKNPSWYFFAQPGGSSFDSWMSSVEIAEARRTMTDLEARRLYDGEWIPTAIGEPFLPREAIWSCVGEPTQPPPYATVYLGVDFGHGKGDRDRTAMSVVWFDGDRVHVSELECWGNRATEVQVADVEEWINARLASYPNAVVVADKYQLLGVLQNLENRGVRVHRFEFSSPKLTFAMAENLERLVSSRKIVFGLDAGFLSGETLADEVAGLIKVPTQFGYRFDHKTSGYSDRTVAVGMAAYHAILDSELPPTPQADPPPRPLWTPSPLDRIQSINWAGQAKLFGMAA